MRGRRTTPHLQDEDDGRGCGKILDVGKVIPKIYIKYRSFGQESQVIHSMWEEAFASIGSSDGLLLLVQIFNESDFIGRRTSMEMIISILLFFNLRNVLCTQVRYHASITAERLPSTSRYSRHPCQVVGIRYDVEGHTLARISNPRIWFESVS